MPRPKKHTECVRKEVYIPVPLMALIATLHFDPVRKSIQYGSFPDYILSLIRKDLRERGYSV